MKINNKIILGAVSGLLGNAAVRLVGSGARRLSGADREISHGHTSETAATVMSALSAIPLTYILARTGRDKAITKGAIFGCAVWLGLRSLKERAGVSLSITPDGSFSSLANGVVFGATASLLIKRLGDPRIFRDYTVVEPTDSEEIYYDDMEDDWASTNKVYNGKYIH